MSENLTNKIERVSVRTGRPYEVLIGRGLLAHTEELIPLTGVKKVAVITDETVAPLYASPVEESLRAAGVSVCRCTFPGGETHKSIKTVETILEFLARENLTRTDMIIALGGGIVGDVAGFVASTFLRGIKFCQLPTTFLAAVDSSVGGKTGVNLTAGKNLAGAFYQPTVVVCDCDTFQTLSDEIFADGRAEAIKYGIIRDEKLFEQLKDGVYTEIEKIVKRCVEIKAEIVAGDELDHGQRQLLNFGHTIGHAIEKRSAFSITHGHAVAIGMALMARAADQNGVSKENCADRLCAALIKNGLPVRCPFPPEELLDTLLSDKKRSGDRLNLVVPERIGNCTLLPLHVGEVLDFIKAGF